MTETLRVQEEVGSLRAIVNTMRMRESRRALAQYRAWCARCRLTLAEVMTDRAPRTPILASTTPQPPVLQHQTDSPAARRETSSGVDSRETASPSLADPAYRTSPESQLPASSQPAHLFTEPYDPAVNITPSLGLAERRDALEESSSASIIESIAFSSRDNTFDYTTPSSSPRLPARYTSHSHDHRRTPGTEAPSSWGRAGSLPTSMSGSSSSRAPSSSAYAAALRDMSRRGASRSASIIGGVGGVVGEPMGVPGMGPGARRGAPGGWGGEMMSVGAGGAGTSGSTSGSSRSSRESI